MYEKNNEERGQRGKKGDVLRFAGNETHFKKLHFTVWLITAKSWIAAIYQRPKTDRRIAKWRKLFKKTRKQKAMQEFKTVLSLQT